MSAKMKLVSCIGAFILVLGLVIVGVLAASSESITMNGSVQFQVNDRSLFVKDVRMQEPGTEEVDISNFTPGYINGDFNFMVGDFENNRGSFTLYFDIINTTTTRYDVSVDYSGLSNIAGLEINVSDQIPANLEAITTINDETPISTTLSLTIVNPNLATIDLSKVIITIEEHVLEIYQSFDFELIDGTVNEVRITGHSGGENVVIPKTFSFEETPINSFKIIDQIGTGLGEKQTISAYLGEVIYTYSNGEGGTANFYSLENIMSVDSSLYPITFVPTYRFEFNEYSEENADLLLLTLLGPSNVGYTQNINYYLTNDQFKKQAFTTEEFTKYLMTNYPGVADGDATALKPLFATGPIILETDPLTENIIYEGTDYIVKEIGDRAFDYLTNLTSIIIPEGVTSIGSSAFLQCENLSSVSIPNSMISIGNDAFTNCYNLTSITIPEGVTSIGESAFFGCSSLTSITINAITPPTLGSNAIPSSETNIYVPEDSVSAYQAASGWSSYSSKISAIV